MTPVNLFFKSRNNRFLLAVIAFVFTFSCLYKSRYSHEVHYVEQTFESITKPNEDEKIVYSMPRVFLNRIQNLEQKVENVTNLFLRITRGSNENKSILSSFLSNFMNTNIDDFWKSRSSKNVSSISSLYEHNASSFHETNLRSTHQCNGPIKVLVLITTHVSHLEQRNVIRQTWGIDASNPPRWKTYFLIGRARNDHEFNQVKHEIEMYNDLVLGDVYEDFYNLTYKVQMGFEWSIKYCSYDFMLKGDDDVFINMQQVFSFLDSKEVPNTELYAGNVQYQALVFRSGKYGVEKEEFDKKIYPRYCSGGGFILSYDVVEKMIYKFKQVPALKIDDAYIGVLALKCGVDVFHNSRFRMFEDERRENRCVFTKNNIVYHPVKIRSCMEYLYKQSLTK